MGVAGEGCMAPFLAIVALWNTWIHGGTSNSSYVLPKVEGSVDEGFSFGTVLRVPDVNPYDRHVRVFGSTDNAEVRQENDFIEHAGF